MNDLIDRVKALLAANGWTVVDGTAIACKDYATAVGPKRAHVYLADYGPATTGVALYADYQSEGRNVCESGGVLIPKGEVAGLAESVERFAAAADAAIGASYAVRLLRRAA